MNRFAYVGSWSIGSTEGAGIVVLDRDVASGRLGRPRIASAYPCATFLARHPTLPVLYATSEDDNRVAALEIRQNGELGLMSSAETGGVLPCHVSVHPEGTLLFVANYGDGSWSVHPLDGDGKVEDRSQVLRQTGHGVDALRQEGPHVHTVLPVDGGTHVIVTDLGTDEIRIHSCNVAAGSVDGGRTLVQAPPGAGPRHVAFDALGRRLFVTCELSSTVEWVLLDAELRAIDTGRWSATVDDRVETNYPSDLWLDRESQRLYVANRGADVISIFDVTQLPPRGIGDFGSGGEDPRHLAFDAPFLDVCNHKSGHVSTFVLDRSADRPELVGAPVEVPNAACIALT